MSYDFTGKIFRMYDTEQIKDTFKKREFVIEQQDGQYPNYVKFELTQDRCGLIDNYSEGDEVTVSFDLSGRQWNDKFFTNLRAWRVQAGGGSGGGNEGGGSYQSNQGGSSTSGSSSPNSNSSPAQEPTFSGGATNDDLPF